jgi:hypothetical protein
MYPNFKPRYTVDFQRINYDNWALALGLHHNLVETYFYIELYKYRLLIGKIYKIRGGQ